MDAYCLGNCVVNILQMAFDETAAVVEVSGCWVTVLIPPIALHVTRHRYFSTYHLAALPFLKGLLWLWRR
jgi:hypothetical protein